MRSHQLLTPKFSVRKPIYLDSQAKIDWPWIGTVLKRRLQNEFPYLLGRNFSNFSAPPYHSWLY